MGPFEFGLRETLFPHDRPSYCGLYFPDKEKHMKKKAFLLAFAVSGLTAVSSQAITIYGLGLDSNIYSFDSATPGTVSLVGTPGNGIVDVDFRGSNGVLYGISGTGSTFGINLGTGGSTLLSTPASTLNGSVSGFDVNPAADRFRVVTNAVAGNNNYRLSSPGSDTGTVTSDGTFQTPIGVTILDVAYINPFSGSSGTALYSIGSDSMLYMHSTLGTDGAGTFNGMTAIGALGFTVGSNVAFDIAGADMAYLANGTDFYTVNLTTGLATSAGTLGQAFGSFSAVPEPSSVLLGGLGALALLRRGRRA